MGTLLIYLYSIEMENIVMGVMGLYQSKHSSLNLPLLTLVLQMLSSILILG